MARTVFICVSIIFTSYLLLTKEFSILILSFQLLLTLNRRQKICASLASPFLAGVPSSCGEHPLDNPSEGAREELHFWDPGPRFIYCLFGRDWVTTTPPWNCHFFNILKNIQLLQGPSPKFVTFALRISQFAEIITCVLLIIRIFVILMWQTSVCSLCPSQVKFYFRFMRKTTSKDTS